MTLATIATWFASALAVSAAITACAAAWFGSEARRSRQYTKLLERFEQLEEAVGSHDTAILNLRARLGMQATRAKRAGARDSTESSPQSGAPSDEEAARVRRELGKTIHPLGVAANATKR